MEEKERNENALDRFTPNKSTKVSKSVSKRVALFMFMGSGAVFALIMLAIAGSDEVMRGSAPPPDIISPAITATGIIPPIELRTPDPEPEEEEEPVYTPPQTVTTPQQQQTVVTAPVVVPPPMPPVRSTVVPAYGRRDTQRMPFISQRRRSAHEARMGAAASSTVVGSFGGGGGAAPESSLPGVDALDASMSNNNSGMSSGAMDMGDSGSPVTALSEPNGWSRKDAFVNQGTPQEYSTHTVSFQRSSYEIKAGTIIPCVLISGLNSDLPGNAIGQVSENVWDTATGRYLLIPRGSRVIGNYDNQVTYGQNRALVVWNRLIFPDGTSLVLDNLKGADQSGYAGFKGQVNNHWGQLITSALLVSLIGAGVELAEPNRNNNNNNNNNNNRNVGNILSERVATAIADVLTQIIQRDINRQPTLKIKPGYRFVMMAQRDIVFPGSWRR